MFEKRSGTRALGDRTGSAAVAASLLVHSLLLIGWGREHRPLAVPPPPPEPPVEEVVYLGLSSSLSLAPAPPLPGEPGAASAAPSPPATAPQAPSDTSEPSASPATPDGPQPVPAGTEPSPGEAAGPSSLVGGYRDPRLHLDARVSRDGAPRPLHERLPSEAHAAIRAYRDSVAAATDRARVARQATIMGRKIPVFGNDTAFHHRGLQAMVTGRPIITPEDGPAFQEQEIHAQEQARERDRVLRERIRATRARREAERARPESR